MSVFEAAHHKSGRCSLAFQVRNFVPGIMPSLCGLCRPGAPPRNGVRSGRRSEEVTGMPGRPRGLRAILAWSLLCSALAGGEARSEPDPEAIAHGKALTIAGDCASCHTADPAKPFAGGKRIDTPFGAIYSPNLTPDRDTGIGALERRGLSPRAAPWASPPTARAITPPSPIPISQSWSATTFWRSAPISRRWRRSATPCRRPNCAGR